jgi:hypothetical protein
MLINKYAYLVVGIIALVGVYAYSTQILDSGFSTDTSILTMELPLKEGINAKPTFTLQTTLPTIPDTVAIYKMVSPTVTAQSVMQLADLRISNLAITPALQYVVTPTTKLADVAAVDRLKVQAAPVVASMAAVPSMKLNTVEDLGNVFTFATETSYLAVDKASGAESVLFDKQASLSERKVALPSEDVLKQNADAFVAQINLLPPGYVYSGMSYLKKQMLGQNGPEGQVENVLGIAKYSRTIDGIPVEGAGSTICVLLGDGGKVQGYNKVSRDIRDKIAVSSQVPLKVQADMTTARQATSVALNPSKVVGAQLAQQKSYQLLSPEEAFKSLQEIGLTTEIADVTSATVTDVHLAYYEAEGNKKQDETEPVYVFSGVATGPGGTTEYREVKYALAAKAGAAPFEMTSAVKEPSRGEKPTTSPGTKD